MVKIHNVQKLNKIFLFLYVSGFTTFAHIPTGSTGVTITQGNAYCFLSKL